VGWTNYAPTYMGYLVHPFRARGVDQLSRQRDGEVLMGWIICRECAL
jgi:hypothetical protein